ncbi:hypothetical protein SORBI_3006G190200 [Sorghum bicolor]|uniref:Uncharacterized protein n=1 Tax=Sorghum bicolor TaxID=4558 RepID=A0A1B6PMT9_SORBI|nr:hypothetical protein SORBI_3006G190200 [Sorghum bicolor]
MRSTSPARRHHALWSTSRRYPDRPSCRGAIRLGQATPARFVNDYVLYLSFLNLEGSGVYNLLFAYDKTCVRFCTMSILH